MAYRLGVDLGTTFTAAAVDDGSGPTMVGLGNRALQVPSVLFLQQDGTFLFGEAAERRAAVEPDRAVREFKRRLGDTVPILVAGRPFSAQALTARLLGWVIERVVERQGSAPDEVVLTYPANWGGYKRELLDQVVTLADLPGAVTCTEPEAAASQYTTRSRLSPGDQLVVYDLGGGTFDVCVLQKQEVGFRILGSPDGIEHLGGIDFDEAVFGQVLAELGDAAAGLDPADPLVTAGVARLRRECVEAKEALSNDVDAVVPVTLPGLSVSVRVTRTDFEALITPALRRHLGCGTAGAAVGRYQRRQDCRGGVGGGKLSDPAGQPPASGRVRWADGHGHPSQARHSAGRAALPAGLPGDHAAARQRPAAVADAGRGVWVVTGPRREP